METRGRTSAAGGESDGGSASSGDSGGRLWSWLGGDHSGNDSLGHSGGSGGSEGGGGDSGGGDGAVTAVMAAAIEATFRVNKSAL